MLDAVFIFAVTLFTALISLVGGLLFLSNSKLALKLQKLGPAIAAAVLLWAVFGEIIPEILESETLENLHVLYLILAGFLACGLFGWIFGHFHHHADLHRSKPTPKLEKTKSPENIKVKVRGKSPRKKPISSEKRFRAEAYAMLFVDCIHNAADGIVIGVSFIAGPTTGLITCLATIAHEIPQEIGDFAIMQKSKMPREKILKLQLRSSLVLIPAALIAYFVGDSVASSLPVVLSVVSGFLLYIAFSELYYIFDLLRSRVPKQLK